IDIMIMGLFQGVSPNISILILLKPNIKYYYIYIVVYLIFLFAYIRLVFNIRASYKDIKDGQKGTSRFATIDEIKKQYIKIPEKDIEFDGYGGIPIARDGNFIFIDDSNTNSLLLGITRSGKGEIFVLPMIDIYSRSRLKPSIIISDTKGELTRLSYKMLVERGYDVKVINLLDLNNTNCYNPLELIIDAYKNDELGEAQLLCKSFTFSLYHNP
ncbi:type IV secretory system conjugative DNA transfer family protein, partial [Clostridium paraputrificum]|uniref:type IV secretory system conjugative DNA transfer family protein n=1 Tax=Clostridium paraputrificum TaxID=29363 RepID=UPI00374FD51E